MTSTSRRSEAAFETVIEQHLLAYGYVAVARDGFDRKRAIFPPMVKQRTTVHFAVDTDAVLMTMRLAGSTYRPG